MSDPLILRRANVSRKGGEWQHEDYDVFDGDRCVGRIFLDNARGGDMNWFWGVSFDLTGRKSYGHASMLAEAKAAFRAEYFARKERGRITSFRPRPRGVQGFQSQHFERLALPGRVGFDVGDNDANRLGTGYVGWHATESAQTDHHRPARSLLNRAAGVRGSI